MEDNCALSQVGTPFIKVKGDPSKPADPCKPVSP